MSTPLLPIPLPGARALEDSRQADTPAKVRELAHEFEGMLLAQMLKQMRQSMDLGAEAGEEQMGFGKAVMTDAIDAELVRQLSLAGGIGIADVIADAFEKQQALQAAASERAAHGGTPSPASLPFEAPQVARPLVPPTTPSPVPARRETPAAMPVPARQEAPAVTAPAAAPAASRPVSAIGTSGVAGTTIRGAEEAALPMPVAAAVTSKYGWRADPFNGQARFHGGVDVRAAYGTAVPSVAAGRVVSSGERGGYGLTVVVEHGPGLQTRYAHLSASLVREGDMVTVGQSLGRVGSSGRSTGPHLHFEVVKDGQRLDPEQAAERFRAAGGFKPREETADSSLGRDPSPATEE